MSLMNRKDKNHVLAGYCGNYLANYIIQQYAVSVWDEGDKDNDLEKPRRGVICRQLSWVSNVYRWMHTLSSLDMSFAGKV